MQNSSIEVESEPSGLDEQDHILTNSPMGIANESTTSSAEPVQAESDLDTINEIVIDGMQCEFVNIRFHEKREPNSFINDLIEFRRRTMNIRKEMAVLVPVPVPMPMPMPLLKMSLQMLKIIQIIEIHINRLPHTSENFRLLAIGVDSNIWAFIN